MWLFHEFYGRTGTWDIRSPLYGRRTAQFKIHPFTFFEEKTDAFIPLLQKNKAILYGVTGGIPEYLSGINGNLSLEQNLIDLFLMKAGGRLFEEPVNLLKQELREPATYHSIISAIAGAGASQLNEIAGKTGLGNQLDAATRLHLSSHKGIIRKETPVYRAGNQPENDLSSGRWYVSCSGIVFVRPNISWYYPRYRKQFTETNG